MKPVIKCIIIDDELPAIDILVHYVSKVPQLKLIGGYTDPIKGLEVIRKEKAQLVFLDIQMDNLTGLQLASIVNDDVKIIFCTAFPEFAINGYDMEAVDYLLKPVSFDRFLRAVQKVLNVIDDTKSSVNKTDNFLFVKTGQKGKLIKINFNDIKFIEAKGNYVAFHTSDKDILAYGTMNDLERSLPSEQFLRIQKSYIVNISLINKIQDGYITIKTHEGAVSLPIGNTYKNALFERINRYIT